MPNTPAEVITKAKEAERRFNAARDDLRALRAELLHLAHTTTVTEAQRREATRMARKGATRRRRRS